MATSYQSSFLKASIDGPNGAGKSGTAMRLAVGIALEYGGGPIVGFDSEERMRFLKKTICDVEKVELIIVPGKSLITLHEAQDRAEIEGASVFLGDQLTTPWMEGLKAFSYENGSLPFDRRQQLMNQWEPVIDKFRYGKYHAICCGRLGYHWTNVEDPETGDLKLVQGDSKFNAGGGNNFGYEAELELEMRRRKRTLLGLLRGKTSVEYVCDVIKDAAGGILNGKQFVFPGSDGPYKKGDYKVVLEAFRPYIEFLREIEPPSPNPQNTRQLLKGGKTDWARDQAERKSLLEELDANLSMCFQGGEGKSKQAAMFRNLTLEALNGFISWGRQEDEVPTPQLERNVLIMKAMRKRIESGEIPTNHNALVGLLKLSTDDVLHPGNGKTLIEVMTAGSLPKRGPQPIVAELERTDREAELAGD
jgi:hypothetical protein